MLRHNWEPTGKAHLCMFSKALFELFIKSGLEMSIYLNYFRFFYY